MLRSFFGDEFQFFVNVEYDFNLKQVGTDFSYVLKKKSYDFIILIQWIWENSGKKVDAAKWQKSSKSNHRGDQGLGSKGIMIQFESKFDGFTGNNDCGHL